MNKADLEQVAMIDNKSAAPWNNSNLDENCMLIEDGCGENPSSLNRVAQRNVHGRNSSLNSHSYQLIRDEKQSYTHTGGTHPNNICEEDRKQGVVSNLDCSPSNQNVTAFVPETQTGSHTVYVGRYHGERERGSNTT